MSNKHTKSNNVIKLCNIYILNQLNSTISVIKND